MNDIERAIDILKRLRIATVAHRVDGFRVFEPLTAGIEALEKQLNSGWIPVENALPDENENVIVTIKEIANEVGGYRYYTSTAWLQEGQWIFKRNQYNPVVIAWQNFPKEYKEGLDE